ncbi:MAG: ABC transporter ATP-binding protein [Chitinispirillaceae bacterium]|nr:ABC transporter ATP-binding protein [Chitinispirillaceae bacterium]
MNEPIAEKIVEVKELRKEFIDDAGRFDVLKNTAFSIHKGEMIALLGISGAGKTTLLQILGGLDSFNGGSVKVCGRQLGTMRMHELAEFRNRHVGFVFQFHHLLPDFTALENTIIPGLLLKKPKNDCIKKAKELLGYLGLKSRESHFPTELSGGERQRVALARALLNDPALILADEPTGNLDRGNGELLLNLFEKTNKELNQTFFIATHNTQMSPRMHRTLLLENCTISESVSEEHLK